MSSELKGRKTYVTVYEAALLCNRSVRTLYRWIEQERVHVNRDERSRSVRIDLDDIKHMQATKPDTVHPVRDAIADLESNEEDHEQRIEKIEQQLGMLLQRVDFLMSQQQSVGTRVVLPQKDRSSRVSGAESRGLPHGTLRLAPYASQHNVAVGQIKSLFYEHEIDLIRHHREGGPIRNKQEWWISPEQQVQLVHYWQEHHIPYTPCGQCQGCVGEMQNSEID